MAPILSQDKVKQSDIVFQKSQEEGLRTKLDNVLGRLLGKNTFHVSVMMTLNDEFIEEETIERDPKSFKETYTEETRQDFERLKDRAMERRPALISIQSAVAQREGVLPGLLPSMLDISELESLPGFPSVPQSFGGDAKNDSVVDDILEPEGASELHTENKDLRNFTKTIEESKVVMNEIRKKRYTPHMRIKSMVVNVVIDKDHFSLLTITEDDLRGILEGVSALNEARGDRLLISLMPFIEKPFDFNRFYLKNKYIITAVSQIFDKIKWALLGLLGLAGFSGLGWFIYGWLKVYRAKRAGLEEDLRLQRLLENKEKEKLIIDELEEKRKAVIDLAKAKPNDVANLIMNWVEASDKEGGSDGGT
jgi:flagellar biosynthesis/type III secretory pathway M-ring protein FliF/YscJ